MIATERATGRASLPIVLRPKPLTRMRVKPRPFTARKDSAAGGARSPKMFEKKACILEKFIVYICMVLVKIKLVPLGRGSPDEPVEKT
jgi:hypothetical protein